MSDIDFSSDDDQPADEEACASEYALACSRAGASRCGRWMRACASRETVCSLRHYGIGALGCLPLCQSLMMNDVLCDLDLSDNGLGSEGAVGVLTVLLKGGARALRVLSLSRNQAGVEAAEAVARLLRCSPPHPLLRLEFSANALGDRGAKAIAEGLAHNCSLHSILLDDNDIDVEGAVGIATALKSNTCLEELSLEWNSVRAEGGRAIADALQGQYTLKKLNLGWNGLLDDGVVAVASAMSSEEGEGETKKPCGLTQLRLHQNKMSTKGSGALAFAIKDLALLDVSGNPLGSDGASALLFALQDSGCSLIAQGVCVRPETPVHLLLSQAASGDGIGLEDLQQAGVDTLAARALLEGSDAIREARRKTAVKDCGAKSAGLTKPKTTGKSKPSTSASSKGCSHRRNGSENVKHWRRTDQCPKVVERNAVEMRW